MHLNLHPRSRRVLDHVAFADAYQTVYVKPSISEYRRVVRQRIHLAARSRHTAHDRKLAALRSLQLQPRSRVRLQPHAHTQVAQWVPVVKQLYTLYVLLVEEAQPPVAVEHMLSMPRPSATTILKAAVRSILVAHLHNPAAVAREYYHSHRERVELNVSSLLQEHLLQRVAQAEVQNLLVRNVELSLAVYEAQALPVARSYVELLDALRPRHILIVEHLARVAAILRVHRSCSTRSPEARRHDMVAAEAVSIRPGRSSLQSSISFSHKNTRLLLMKKMKI